MQNWGLQTDSSWGAPSIESSQCYNGVYTGYSGMQESSWGQWNSGLESSSPRPDSTESLQWNYDLESFCSRGNLNEARKKFQERGLNQHAVSEHNKTYLMTACENSSSSAFELVKYLVDEMHVNVFEKYIHNSKKEGSYYGTSAHEGFTALHFAALANNQAVISFLLSKGGQKLFEIPAQCKTAERLAIEKKYANAIAAFKEFTEKTEKDRLARPIHIFLVSIQCAQYFRFFEDIGATDMDDLASMDEEDWKALSALMTPIPFKRFQRALQNQTPKQFKNACPESVSTVRGLLQSAGCESQMHIFSKIGVVELADLLEVDEQTWSTVKSTVKPLVFKKLQHKWSSLKASKGWLKKETLFRKRQLSFGFGDGCVAEPAQKKQELFCTSWFSTKDQILAEITSVENAILKANQELCTMGEQLHAQIDTLAAMADENCQELRETMWKLAEENEALKLQEQLKQDECEGLKQKLLGDELRQVISADVLASADEEKLYNLEKIVKGILEDIQSAKEELKCKKELCCVCLANRKDTILMPCMHLCMCAGCSKNGKMQECPICRCRIQERRQVYG